MVDDMGWEGDEGVICEGRGVKEKKGDGVGRRMGNEA